MTVEPEVWDPITGLVNRTQPLISLSMSYNVSGTPNIVSICTINTTSESALGLYVSRETFPLYVFTHILVLQIPEDLGTTDFLEFQINITLPPVDYSTFSAMLPNFNISVNNMTADKLILGGEYSNIALFVGQTLLFRITF